MLRPFTRLHEPLAFVRQFTPNWFAMTMGTGVLAQVVAKLPLSFPGQLLLAEGLWWLTVLLFGLFSVLFAARLLLFRDTLWPMLDHPVQSMFLGAIPMGLVQVINGLLLFAAPVHGASLVALAHGLWWLALVLALGAALGVPYLMFTRQKHVLESLTGVWLLPIVAPEVVASGAAALAPHLAAESAQLLLSLGYAVSYTHLTLPTKRIV